MKKVVIGFDKANCPQAFAIVESLSECIRNMTEFMQDGLRVILCSLEIAKKIWG